MDYALNYKRKLPHFQPQDAVLFITFRINIPIPPAYYTSYNNLKSSLQAKIEPADDPKECKNTIRKKLFAYMDDFYDSEEYDFSLTENPAVAQIVYDKFLALAEKYYYPYIMTIMPSHIHLLIKPHTVNDSPVSMAEILRLLKGGTAFQINKLLNRSGSLWYREFHDYWVRNQEELCRIFEYIRQNPCKAALVNDPAQWRWTWINPDIWM